MIHIRKFLQTVFLHKQEEEYIELRFIDKEKRPTDHVWFHTLEETEDYINKNKARKNCYFGIHPRFVPKGGNEAVETAFTLYVDLDYNKVDPDENKAKQIIQERIESFGKTPTIVVDSGYGKHIYYCLNKRYKWEEIKDTLAEMVEFFKGDRLLNKDRIFRIPNTNNIKHKPYRECRVTFLDKKVRYSLEDIKSVLERKGLAKEKKKKEEFAKVELDPVLETVGFQRRRDGWELGKCPNCGNNSLYIYDNNPSEVRCSHTGNCLWVEKVKTFTKEVRTKLRMEGSSFNPLTFISYLKSRPASIKTGYPKLDSVYEFRIGTFNLLASRLSHGKSSFAYNLVLNMAEAYPDSNFPFFSFEINKEIMQLRLMTILYAKARKDNLIDMSEMERDIKAGGPKGSFALKKLGKLSNIHFYDDPNITLSDTFDIMHETEDVGAAFVDYLECVDVGVQIKSEEQRVASIAMGYRKFVGKEKTFPLICLSQINREVKKREDDRPTEVDIRYSDKPLQESSIGWGLYNREAAKTFSKKKKGTVEDMLEDPDETRTEAILEVIALKNRFGKRTREFMAFNQASGLIEARKGAPRQSLGGEELLEV